MAVALLKPRATSVARSHINHYKEVGATVLLAVPEGLGQRKSRTRQSELGAVNFMSYLYRASAVALSVVGIVVILGMSQATGHVVTQHQTARYATAAFKHRVSSKRHHHHRHHRFVLPRDYAAWSKVAGCEESGWHVAGGEYPDSLGINVTNYEAFHGTPQAPGTPTLKQRVMQIRVADRLIRSYGIAIPDQNGCDGGW
jgi:hypothetical protein